MQPQQGSRIDLVELKAHLVKKIGAERFKKYFYYLNRFLSQKLTKTDFDKSCFHLLGKENLPLHNQLIRSILKNACRATSAPGPTESREDHNASVWSNRVLPISPRKARSGIRGERKAPGGSSRVVTDNGETKPPFLAPLGIPFCPASIGGSRKARAAGSSFFYDNGGLSDSEMLRKRMDQIASLEGIGGGVSMECANTVNNMLDVYLKRLIKSSVDLVGSRGPQINKQLARGKGINGIWPANHVIHEQRLRCSKSISLLDFKVAMELNPRQLGEDWPLFLEKISMKFSDK